MDGDLGASLVATNQAEYVQPPEPEPIEPEPPESGEWTSTPEEAAAAVRPKREYRKRQQQPAPELLPQP